MDRLTGIHAVREALEANRPLDSLIVARGSHGNRIEELVRLARQHGVPVRFEERIQLDRTADTREHQGVVALVAASPSASFEDLLKPLDPQTGPGLLVLLDGVEILQVLYAVKKYQQARTGLRVEWLQQVLKAGGWRCRDQRDDALVLPRAGSAI